MRKIRARVGETGIDASRVMATGFSAGGHLAVSLATRLAADVYAAAAVANRLSARPDASELVDPVNTRLQPHAQGSNTQNMIGSAPSADALVKYLVETSVPIDAPAALNPHAKNIYVVPVKNAPMADGAFRKADVKASLHTFEHESYGFGLRGIAKG